jgi:hypothetical protein
VCHEKSYDLDHVGATILTFFDHLAVIVSFRSSRPASLRVHPAPKLGGSSSSCAPIVRHPPIMRELKLKKALSYVLTVLGE